ncbi:cell division protein FtsK, partial [Streptomyces tanashiensis]
MASRTSGKGSQGTANTAKPRAGRTTGAAKKAAPAKSPAKPPAKKAPAKKAAPAKRAPARKTAAKKAAPRPAPSPTGGVYRLARGAWLGLAHGIGAMFRGIGRGAKGLDPAHRKDGLALLLLGLALIVAAGTWSNLRGPVGDLVEMLVTGSFGRLDLLVPLLLGAIGIRLILYPEKPEANGRISIGLSALVIGVLGQVHIACGSPGRGDGSAAMQDAGGLIGWAASQPLVFMMGEVLAVPMLVLLTVFGLLVVTATPVNAIPQRLRALGAKLGIIELPYDPAEAEGHHGGPDREGYDEEWRDAGPRPARPVRRRASGPAEPYDVERAEAEMLERRGRPARRTSGRDDFDSGLDPVDVAAAAAAALDGAVLNGMPPSPIVADLTKDVTAERNAAVAASAAAAAEAGAAK